MKGKIILVTVLCLAVAALGIGAAPASAADGCGCHTAVPPSGGAPAAHTPFVVGVSDCTTCHAGWAVPHPTAVKPTLTVRPAWVPNLTGPPPGGWLTGQYAAGGTPVVSVVYLQKRFWGETQFTDIGQASNVNGTATWNGGSLAWPRDRWASCRAVAAGVAGPRVVLPADAIWRPKPGLTLTLGNVGRLGFVTPLGRVIAHGTAMPAKLAGESASLTVFKLKSGKWVPMKSGEATIGAKGAYKWVFGVRRGAYRMRAAIAATEDHQFVRTTWRYFKEK